jgi:hypothetical protein
VDRFVDAETGADTNTACPQANPCDTIAYALANSGAGDRILIDNGSYPESVSLGDDRALVAQDFVLADGGPTIVDGGATTAITVPASGAGPIRGLTIRGDGTGVTLNGAAEVDANTFDDPDASSAIGLVANTPTADVHDNTFLDPAPSATRARTGLYAGPFTALDIRDNSFAGFNLAIQVDGGGLIENNTITGTHNLPGVGRSILASAPTIRENTVEAASGDGVIGIQPGDGASLVRNEVTGHEVGVRVIFDTTGVTLFGDRIWGNTIDGIGISDNGAANPVTSVAATNVTVFGNNLDVRLNGSALTMDSSIIGSILASQSTCTITFSRANASGSDASGCDGFQSTADPMFADDDGGDFHLLAGSPMLDAGNPADPGSGAVDIDGDPRALDATPECTGNVARRDIGADELAPAAIDCDPPETAIDSGPADGSKINDPNPTFTFSSDEAGTFECSVDGGATFGACSHTNQHILDLGSDGVYSFAVRAVDSSDNVDDSPASRTFTLDRAAPDTSFTATPPKRSRRKHVRFGFAADEDAGFECRLDSKPAFTCQSPVAVRVKPGRHVFKVTATDEAGNEELAPASFRFRRLKKR